MQWVQEYGRSSAIQWTCWTRIGRDIYAVCECSRWMCSRCPSVQEGISNGLGLKLLLWWLRSQTASGLKFCRNSTIVDYCDYWDSFFTSRTDECGFVEIRNLINSLSGTLAILFAGSDSDEFVRGLIEICLRAQNVVVFENGEWLAFCSEFDDTMAHGCGFMEIA